MADTTTAGTGIGIDAAPSDLAIGMDASGSADMATGDPSLAHDVLLPYYMTPFGETDVLFIVIIVFILLSVFLIGLFYFKLHSLPEKMAHDTAQFQLVAILALIALFTHNNLFWIFAILLAAIKLPDFITPVMTIARSQERLTRSVETMAASLATMQTERAGGGEPPDRGSADAPPSGETLSPEIGS